MSMISEVKDKGVYCLIFRNQQCKFKVGSLGDVYFAAGYHIYVGSAQGTGGLKRLYRHVMLSKEEGRKAKWHVDYINLDDHFELICTVHAVTYDHVECLLAGNLQSDAVHGFGCSDCTCKSHLFYRCCNPIDELVKVFRRHGLEPLVEELP
jgi:Uri superfamily endonuclease